MLYAFRWLIDFVVGLFKSIERKPLPPPVVPRHVPPTHVEPDARSEARRRDIVEKANRRLEETPTWEDVEALEREIERRRR